MLEPCKLLLTAGRIDTSDSSYKVSMEAQLLSLGAYCGQGCSLPVAIVCCNITPPPLVRSISIPTRLMMSHQSPAMHGPLFVREERW